MAENPLIELNILSKYSLEKPFEKCRQKINDFSKEKVNEAQGQEWIIFGIFIAAI